MAPQLDDDDEYYANRDNKMDNTHDGGNDGTFEDDDADAYDDETNEDGTRGKRRNL